jgi:putative copper resistance protein D
MHDMPSMLPPLDWQSFLHTWEFRPVWCGVALLAVLGYGAGLVVCRRHRVRGVHPVRAVSFFVGVALLVFTVSSAIDVYAMAVFWDHMVEHLMLIMLIPALLVLGGPLTLLWSVASTGGRGEVVDRFLRSAPVAVVTNPLVGLGIYSVVIVATHLTSFMDVMATHAWVMHAEQVLYLVSGYLFLLPLIGGEPIRWRLPHLARLALVLVAMTPDTLVGIVLMQTNYNMFPVMESMRPMWAPPPLHDLATAGALMWAGGDGLMMLIGLGVVLAMITDRSQDAVLGKRLEGVRRATLTSQLSRGDSGRLQPHARAVVPIRRRPDIVVTPRVWPGADAR